MVEAGPAVEQDQGRLGAHRSAVGHQAGALNVEIEPHAVDEHAHARETSTSSIERTPMV
jgi:hypothetical protein